MTTPITKEQAEAVFDLRAGYQLGNTDIDILRKLAEYALAAIDAEPVADVVAWHKEGEERTCDIRWRRFDVAPGPLFTVAQPGVTADADDNFYSWFGREWHDHYQQNQYTTAAKQMLGVMAESAWNACRAAMLNHSDDDRDMVERVSQPYKLPDNSFTNDDLEMMAHGDNPQANAYRELLAFRRNSPAIPDGWQLVPKRLTAENGAKRALSGEFSETKFINCPECFGDEDCETCDGSGRIEISVPVSWTTIKAIWAKGVEHFSEAPQQEGM
ncbi:hypothetical protein ACRW5G_16600 [Escherichia coli]